MSTLTERLVSLATLPSYEEAIQHPFLLAAGDGTLPSERLALWLSQDRIYAVHAYPAFIGALITNIPWDSSCLLQSLDEQRNQRILATLVFCLENIVREVTFFKDAVDKWSLNIEIWKERKGTRNYTTEMAKISKTGNIADGLIFLWAMERVYLDAWTFVHNQLQKRSQDLNSAVGSFAANWSCPDMINFVDRLTKLVDDLNIQPGTDAWRRAEDIWSRVVELEVDFWPVAGEEISHRTTPN